MHYTETNYTTKYNRPDVLYKWTDNNLIRSDSDDT